MAMKSKVKAKIKARVRSKAVVKKKTAKKLTSKPSVKAKPTRKIMTKPSAIKAKSVTMLTAKPKAIVEAPIAAKLKPTAVAKSVTPVLKRVVNPLAPRRPIKRSQRANQFTYMKAPGLEHEFEVGGAVEVFCDHEKNHERIRGWVKGIVVQVDHKMVAVQFRSNVYLTDGWMVPDRILWYPVNSEHIRAVAGRKIVKKDFIPEY
jgi:hypothetical protein